MSSGEAVAVFELAVGGWEVFCLEHGGRISRWTDEAFADDAAARHRRGLHE